MTLSREPNTYNSGNLREYLRLWLGNQTHIYGKSKYPSIQYMYPCDSLRFFNSIHNTLVNLLRVTCRRSLFSPFAFLPFATRSEGQVYLYASYAKYTIITFVVFPRSLYLHTSRRYSCKLYLRFLSTQSLVPVSETVRYSWS